VGADGVLGPFPSHMPAKRELLCESPALWDTNLPGNKKSYQVDTIMHVLHVIDSMHGGGAESSILEIVPGLERRGVATSIVTLLADDGCLTDRLKQVGITPIRLRNRRPSPFSTSSELLAVIRSLRPDVVHTSLMYSNLFGRVSGRLAHVPVVTTLANLDYGPEHRAHSQVGPWAVRCAHGAELLTAPLTTRFHAISHEVANVMGRRLRIPGSRIQVVYRGRDTARLGVVSPERRLSVRKSLGLEADTPLILSVGRIDQQKGVDTTIKAFKYLSKRIPNAVLLIAGRPGNASVQIEKELFSSPNIRLLGHRTDVPDLMCAADVLSFPSRWEGLGGTVVEAMALRLPLVASNIAPVAEVVGDVGWPLVRPDDPETLSEGLLSVLADTSNDVRRDNAEKRFEKLFTAEAACDGMADFYDKVLSDFRGSR
jgi:glycosyltransferase involved in cell wall biosynthesis